MKFGWCFLGSGNIAHSVALDSAGLNIASVYSPTSANREAFAREFGATAYESAEAAILAPGVDAVYVNSQNPEHISSTLLALSLGKPVLCEKPMGVNARQTGEMISAARRAGLYLSEAMWPRYNPALITAQNWAERGMIGEIRYITADFGSIAGEDIPRVNRLDRGGGAMIDMGIYPLALCQAFAKASPARISVRANLMPSGADRRVAANLSYPDGIEADIYTALDAYSTWTAVIHGTRGQITIPEFWRARKAVLQTASGEEYSFARDGCVGWGYEFARVTEQISSGMKESEAMPLDESLLIARIMDEIRAQAGVVFPWD